MKKFIVNTRSESGDSYTYLIQHPTKPSSVELDRFLFVHANDIFEEKFFESVDSIVEIKDDKFLTIPD